MVFSQPTIDLVGWIYFFAWSLSFYGQLILNYKLKSVEGMNLDFLAMNVTGFSFYSLYCSYGYFVPGGDAATGKVDLNDLFFAYHAIFITLLTVVQACIYPRGNNRIMTATIVYLTVLWTFVVIYGVLTIVLTHPSILNFQGTQTLDPPPRLSVLSFMGYFKLSISFLKYLPQMYWNYVRKSTVGWSICNIMLDFTGGAFSFLQMFMQHSNGKDLHINPVKLALSIISMIYDLIFIIQHYVLYPENSSEDAKPAAAAYSAKSSEVGENYRDLTDHEPPVSSQRRKLEEHDVKIVSENDAPDKPMIPLV